MAAYPSCRDGGRAEGSRDMLHRRDPELLHSAATGDTDAFAELMARYTDRVYRFTAAALGDPGEAEDATQETFIEAYKSAARFDGRLSASAWLLGIASNRCRESRRRRVNVNYFIITKRSCGSEGRGRGRAGLSLGWVGPWLGLG